MRMKVGELARYAGVTVRALHHYDEMGLLRPSARSDSGYRLYNADDVSRLQAIQALQQLALPLDEIARLLDNTQPVDAMRIVDEYIATVEHEIRQAQELRGHLGVLRKRLTLLEGEQSRETLLEALSLMSVYRQFFTAAEITRITENWKKVEHEWPPLVAAVAEAMARGVPHDALELQPLAVRWMELVARWMEGDMALIARWGQLYDQGKGPVSRLGPSREMARYMSQPIAARMALLLKYFTPDELRHLSTADGAPFAALDTEVRRRLAEGLDPGSPQALQLLMQADALLRTLARGDEGLRQRLQLSDQEPLLRAAGVVSLVTKDYLQRVAIAHQLAPAAPPACSPA
jgi:DNA-binding transcriptional MerR regulator